MFTLNKNGQKEFLYGKEAYQEAIDSCKACHDFKADDEDEHVSEFLRSCYNCLFRRWTMSSFVCLKK